MHKNGRPPWAVFYDSDQKSKEVSFQSLTNSRLLRRSSLSGSTFESRYSKKINLLHRQDAGLSFAYHTGDYTAGSSLHPPTE